MMMRKILASAIFMLISLACTASSNQRQQPAVNQYDLHVTPSQGPGISGAPEDPDPLYFNAVYKRRLDSIQKTVPLPYNKFVNDYIGIYIARPAQIGRMVGLSKYYFPVYERIFRENGIPDEIKFLSIVESALDPNAISRSGATGLWQFMYTTALGYGLKMDNYVDERKDPVAASYAAARYFKDAFEELGDWLLAVAAYNCGKGAVSRAIEKAGGVRDFWEIRRFLPLETQNYVPAFIATTYIMNHYSSHAINAVEGTLPAETDVIQVNRHVALSSIARATGLDVNQLKSLNPSYKKQIINGTSARPQPLVLPILDREIYVNLYTALNSADAEPRLILASTKSAGASAAPVYHKVRAGENLSIIANRYKVEVQDLKVWNKLKNAVIVPGQRLIVTPARTARS